MIRDRFRKKDDGNTPSVQGKNKKSAGIRARKDGQRLTKSKKAGLRDAGMVWDCSVLCLARCGSRVYAGPL